MGLDPSVTALRGSAILGVRVVEPAAGIPAGSSISVSRNAAEVIQDSSEVHQIPCHEGRVPIRGR